MRIGKITFDGYNNYGNLLQNYALQEYLKQFSDCVQTIWHSPHERIGEFWRWGGKEEIKFLINHQGFRSELKNGIRAWEFARRVRGMEFAQRYIDIRYDVDSLNSIEDEYDYFVVGSDQVWNPNNPQLETAFLRFAPSEKRIAFAASMGAASVPDAKVLSFRDGINGMNAISVREERAAQIVSELTGRQVEVVLDPVFCISKEKWNRISMRPYWLESEPYIFTYFLGEIPKEVVSFAEEKHYRMINCFDKENINHYIISPEEWLYLIAHASYVLTDSFHASVFSIIFGSPFFVFERRENVENRQMTTRIDSLLSTFDLKERLISDEEGLKRHWDSSFSASDIIQGELEKSESFLKRAFSLI